MAPLLAIAAQLAPYLLPKVAKALGGNKAEKVAETVVDIAENVTGKKGEEAVQAVKNSPETALAFLQAQMAQETKLEEMVAEDRKDAREREIAIVTSDNAPTINKIVTPVLAIGIVMLTFGMCGILSYVADGDLKPSQERVIIFIIGALVPICTQVVSYYFGSSRGDAAQQQTIRDMLKRS